MQTLLIGVAPPLRKEEYFYSAETESAELQHAGMFLVYAAECPLADGSNAAEAVRRAAPTVVKRVQLSYKPKSIVLFGPATAELIPALRDAGLGELLMLADGKPFAELPDFARFKAKGQR
jgi:hypothetical protein